MVHQNPLKRTTKLPHPRGFQANRELVSGREPGCELHLLADVFVTCCRVRATINDVPTCPSGSLLDGRIDRWTHGQTYWHVPLRLDISVRYGDSTHVSLRSLQVLDVIASHPGLHFLREAPEFHSR